MWGGSRCRGRGRIRGGKGCRRRGREERWWDWGDIVKEFDEGFRGGWTDFSDLWGWAFGGAGEEIEGDVKEGWDSEDPEFDYGSEWDKFRVKERKE